VITLRIDKVHVDPVALAELVGNGAGPIVRDHKRRAANVQTAAKVIVRKRTRKLEHSIVTRTTVTGLRINTIIGTDLPYALYEHDGTRPHIIRPRKKKVLRFPAGGGVVFARSVNHPGTTGSFFLARALPLGLD
jgi:hypothetical protein